MNILLKLVLGIVGIVVLGFVVLFSWYLIDTNTGFKDCGTSTDCIEKAIYDCEKATAKLTDETVTVRGKRLAKTTFGNLELCEVNFNHGTSQKTCALPSNQMVNQYSVSEYESWDKYCASGGSPPSSSK